MPFDLPETVSASWSLKGVNNTNFADTMQKFQQYLSTIDVCLYIQHIICQSDLNMHFVAMSDCCLMPNKQYFNYIMAITSLY
jgi:hypothetical protein